MAGNSVDVILAASFTQGGFNGVSSVVLFFAHTKLLYNGYFFHCVFVFVFSAFVGIGSNHTLSSNVNLLLPLSGSTLFTCVTY